MSYRTKIISENDEAIIPIPDEILDALNLKEGDIVSWEVKDGKLYFRKVEASADNT